MDFDELLGKILQFLPQEKRLSYRALKRRFVLDDEYLEDVKAEIIQAKQLAARRGAPSWSGWGALTRRQHLHPSRLLRQSSLPVVRPPLSSPRRLTPNAASSLCCFMTWWTRPCSPASSTRKSCARS